VICIGVSTDHHIGPGRLWVDLARDWASRGVPAVRFDREGLGESGSVIGDLPIAYSVGAATDTVEIATAMSPDDVGNVALVGLCSSAWAAAVGVESLVPRAAYLLNTGAWSRLPPLNWFVEDEADPRPAPGSKPTLKTRWHQSSFKRRFKLGMPQPLWHLLAKRGYVDAPELILSGLTEKTQLTLVFGKADYEVFRDHRGPRAVDRVAVPERLRVIRVDAADHALQNGAGRREVREILAELVPKDLAAG
jgi:hypothetical protein